MTPPHLDPNEREAPDLIRLDNTTPVTVCVICSGHLETLANLPEHLLLRMGYVDEHGDIQRLDIHRIRKALVNKALAELKEKLPNKRPYYLYEPKSGEAWNAAIDDITALIDTALDNNGKSK